MDVIDSLLDLRIFEKIVSQGSLSAAGKDLNLSLAVVSKRLAALEQRLGVRLVQRTTRTQSLTPEGQTFYERSLRILDEVQSAEALMAGRRQQVAGTLTLTAPRSFGRQYLAPLVSEFTAQHGELSVRLMLCDETVDLVEGGIDMAFRFGALADSSMSAREVAPSYRVMCASPAYIARHGQPESLADLNSRRHACIVCTNMPAAQWHLDVDGVSTAVKVRGTYMVNDGEAAQALVLEGAGIVCRSIWDVGMHLDSGRLLPVLPQYSAASDPLHVVVPHGRQVAPRVRLFSDFAVQRLRAQWKWGGRLERAGMAAAAA